MRFVKVKPRFASNRIFFSLLFVKQFNILKFNVELWFRLDQDFFFWKMLFLRFYHKFNFTSTKEKVNVSLMSSWADFFFIFYKFFNFISSSFSQLENWVFKIFFLDPIWFFSVFRSEQCRWKLKIRRPQPSGRETRKAINILSCLFCVARGSKNQE